MSRTPAPLLDDAPQTPPPASQLAVIEAAGLDNATLMFERLAKDPTVPVEKLEKLIELQERIMAFNAEAAFHRAFSQMQAEIPEIDEKGRILNKTGGVQSHYAKNEDIQQVLRPILQRHHFSLSFRTEWPDKATVKVVGILTHDDGYARTSEFLADADTSGNKNAIQALGSSVSYGHRYTTIDLLNITSRGQDDDGEASARAKAPEAPAGYASWVDDMTATAQTGTAAFQKAWDASKPAFRTYLVQQTPSVWAGMKDTAKAADRARTA